LVNVHNGAKIVIEHQSLVIGSVITFVPMTIEELYSIYQKHPVVCTDSRAITQGCLFFALKGENFNGNEFAEVAIQQGAVYAIIDQDKFKKDKHTILVDDVLATLQNLANHHRRQLKCPVIAITGSNGKTTTKELIAAILSKKYKTHYTKGNFNNHIGVPLTILSSPVDTEMVVIEMGANHLNEIKTLSEIAEPGFGIITNVGKAHLEGFGSFEGVKKAKGELYEFLTAHDGLAFASGDNTHISEMLSRTRVKKIIRYGTKYDCECEGRLVESFPFLKVEWKYDSQKGIVATHLIGEYNFENILAAICIANYFEVGVSQINDALQEYIPGNSRSQIIEKNSNVIVLDAYNANPSSMEAALKNFAVMKGEHKIVFLGEMSELGGDSSAEHLSLLKLLQSLSFEKSILVGNKYIEYQSSFPANYFSSSDDAAKWARQQNIKNATILIKGSRSVKMEKVLEGL
jgi:UDP-N-acetylmuramoyl-tripeptide--D-alanyl-D-alanine ligase